LEVDDVVAGAGADEGDVGAAELEAVGSEAGAAG
jgi:hypothetical protein